MFDTPQWENLEARFISVVSTLLGFSFPHRSGFLALHRRSSPPLPATRSIASIAPSSTKVPRADPSHSLHTIDALRSFTCTGRSALAHQRKESGKASCPTGGVSHLNDSDAPRSGARRRATTSTLKQTTTHPPPI